jgi:peptide/nickel transport system substrate-binding protein
LKKLRWQIIVVLLTLAAIGILLLSQQQSSVPEAKQVDQPVSGGVYTEALIGSLERLNPVLDFYNSADYDVDRLIYCRLVRFDHRGLPYGDLAETWGISKDGKRYSFSIRSDAVWHDGQPVTSDDVIFTVDLLRNDQLPVPNDIRAFWKQVEAGALDDKTLQFKLPEAFSPFLDYLNFGILPKHLLGSLAPGDLINSSFNVSPTGCGPFKFNSLKVEDGAASEIVLDGFQGYYGQKPFLDQVIFRYFPDSASALNAFEQEEVMGLSQVAPELLPQALKDDKLNVFTARTPRLSMIYLNLDNPDTPFFQDKIVRRALLMGVNRRWIVDQLLSGQGIIANSPIFPESWASYEGVETVPYDTQAAVALLKKEGYTFPAEGGQTRAKDDIPLSFEVVYPDQEQYHPIAEQIRLDWEHMGITAVMKPVPYGDIRTKYLEPRTYQAALVELNFDRSPDPDPYPFWHQSQIKSGQNYSQWDDRQVSEYLEQARVLEDFSERIKRYRNFQVRFADELPALLLFYPVYTYGVGAQVYGVSMGPIYDPSDRFNNITSWYLITGTSVQPTENLTETP